MKIFVTGATGFIGRHLVRELVKEHDIECLCRKEDGELKDLGCEIIPGSVEKEVDIGRSEIVFHLAALIEGKEEDLMRVNAKGTVKIAKECKRKGTRMIYMSSSAVTGKPLYLPVDENHPYNPRDSYGRSKMEAEKAVIASGADHVILRPPVVYGPREQWLRTLKMVKRGFPIIGSGKNRFHMIYVKNLTEACLLSMKRGGGIYTLADPEVRTLEEMYKIMANSLGVKESRLHIPPPLAYLIADLYFILSRVTGKKPVLNRRNIRRVTEDGWFSIEKARKELGYEGKYSPEEGFRETVEGFRKEGVI